MTPWLQTLRELIPEVALLVWVYAAAALFGYLVGSVNPAALIARVRGADLRGSGSGNPGATNAGRVMGWRVGVAVGLLDVAKGYLPVILVEVVAGDGPARLAGLMAVIGHISSPWLRGRGGKGVATALGAILAVRPLWALPVLGVFAVVVGLTRNVGLASVCGALALIPTALLLRYDNVDLVFAVLLAAIICVRHSRNLAHVVHALRHRQGIPRS
jgi:glycerol-3-phosphate acyltransferase PlsY